MRIMDIPIFANADLPALNGKEMTGWKFIDACKHCVGGRNIAVRQIERESLAVDLARHLGVSQDGLNLRSENETGAVVVVVEGFFSQSVPGQEEDLAFSSPEGKGKHPPQAPQTLNPFFLVEVQDRLRIALGVKDVPLP